MSSVDWAEAQGRWKGMFNVALKKVQKQVHPHMELDEDATEYLDNIMYSLLVHICSMQEEVPMSGTECEQCVLKLFPQESSLLATWAMKEANAAVNKFIDNKRKAATLSEFPVEKAHSRLMKDGSKGKSINIDKLVSIYLMSVLDYIAADVLKLVGEYTTRVDPNATAMHLRDINTAVKGDKALDALLRPLEKLPTQRVVGNHAGIAANLSYEQTVKEIMLAEAKYQTQLDMLTKVFLDMFESNPNLSEEDRDVIFGNVKAIVELTQGLLSLLEECVSLAESRNDLRYPPFGQCLLAFIEDGEMDAYKEYADNFDLANRTLMRVMPQLQQTLQPEEMVLAVEHVLPELLAAPILHMRHYYEVLMLLCNITPADEPDVGRLKQAMSALHNIRLSVSSSRIQVHSRDQSVTMFEQTAVKLQSNIGDWNGPDIATVAKSLTATATDVVIWHHKAGKMAQRIAWTFDTLIIFCKTADKKGYQYRLKERFDLRLATVTIITQPEESDYQHAIKIVDPSGDHLILVTDGPDSTHKWFLALKHPTITKFLNQCLQRKEEEYEESLPDLMPDKSVYPFADRDSDDNIRLETGTGTEVVKGGTLLKLVERLTYPKHADMNYVKDFLISFRSFCEPHVLLDYLVKRYRISEPNSADKTKMRLFSRKIAIPIKLRVVNVLKQWIEKHYDDFVDDHSLLKELLRFIKADLSTNLAMKSKVALLTKSIRRQRDLINSKDHQNALEQPPPVLWPQHITSDTINFFHVMTLHPIEIARQLTRIESETFRAIKASELAGQAWTKKDKATKAPQVLKMIHRFNQVSNWVSRTVLEMKNLEERAETVSIFIEILRELLVLQNFNGAMEVLSGLQRTAVQRLKFTWAEVSAKKCKVIEECAELVASDRSYLKLRTKISQLNPPCIPFFGMYLSDITFVEEGSTDYLTDTTDIESAKKNNADVKLSNLINFGKRRLEAKCIQQVQQYQNEYYNLQDNADIRRFLLDFPPLDVGDANDALELPAPTATTAESDMFGGELYRMSLEAEPRSATDKNDLDVHTPVFPDAAKGRREMLNKLEKLKEPSGVRARISSQSGSHRTLSNTSTSSLQTQRSYSSSGDLVRSNSSFSQKRDNRPISVLSASRRTSDGVGSEVVVPPVPRRTGSLSVTLEHPPPIIARSSSGSAIAPPPRPPKKANSLSMVTTAPSPHRPPLPPRT
eukprot:m.113455 g.113455  ORF g.113455 m.113455 type:complete len:1196 (-) comp28272_c0_seq1:23-3610(-)